mgnify:CR=1 FL=1
MDVISLFLAIVSKHFLFNQNNSYNVTDILQKLSLGSDPYPVISLFAHWKDDGVDGGIDIGGVSKEKKNTSSAIKLESISLKGNHEISKKKSTKLLFNLNVQLESPEVPGVL